MIDPFSIANIAGGLIGGITGLFQRHKANKLLAENPYPTYNIPQEVFANQRAAQGLANQGLPSAQYTQAMQNIQRNQQAGLRAANDRRSGLMAISGLQQGANDATLNLDVANSKQKIANMQNLMNVNNQVAQYRDKAFDWNQKNKYLQNRSYAMQLLGTGGQNITSGLDQILTGGVGLFAGSGGGGRGMSGGQTYQPTYYNGYTPGQGNGFETNY